ncbi:MAG: hypothetical protein ABIT04_00210 [Novosphingobium sp.]
MNTVEIGSRIGLFANRVAFLPIQVHVDRRRVEAMFRQQRERLGDARGVSDRRAAGVLKHHYQ